MGKKQFVFITLILVWVDITANQLYYTVLTNLEGNLIRAELHNAKTNIYDYLIFSAILMVVVLFLIITSKPGEKIGFISQRINIGLMLLGFGALELIGIPFRGIKFLMIAVSMEGSYFYVSNVSVFLGTALILILPFFIGSIIVMREHGFWYLDELTQENLKLSFLTIICVIGVFSAKSIKEIIGVLISSNMMIQRFRGIELLGMVGKIFVVFVIAWSIFSANYETYNTKYKSKLKVTQYLDYIGIVMVAFFINYFIDIELFMILRNNGWDFLKEIYIDTTWQLVILRFIIPLIAVGIGVVLMLVGRKKRYTNSES